MKLIMPLMFSAVLLLQSGISQAGDDRLRLLGSTSLSRAENDRDRINFANCRNDVSRIKLKVRGAPAEIESVVVRFGNGSVQRLPVRDFFKRGSESRWIDVPGKERCVRSITIVGDSQSKRAQARIEVFAR